MLIGCQLIGYSEANCKQLSKEDASKKEKVVPIPRAFPAPRKTTIKYVLKVKNLTNLEEGRSNKHVQITVERLPIDKSALVEVNNIASNGAAQSNPLMGFVTGKNVLEHSSSSPASGDNLVQHCELGIQHSGAGLDAQNLNKDVEQAIHDVFGSPSNTDSYSFVADSVGDVEQHANLFGSVAQDSVEQNVNYNHAKVSDSSDEEVVQCTPVHGAQQHCIHDSAHAANNNSQLVASACQSSSLNIIPRIVKDLSSFSAVVRNDFKALSTLWAKQNGASISKEEEQNNDNAADDGFTMLKSKAQKKYNLRLNRKLNSKFT